MTTTDEEEDLKRAVLALNKAFKGNKTKICNFVHKGRSRVTEILETKYRGDNTGETDDPDDEYHGEDNETKQEMNRMDVLEKEKQGILAELADAKSENERLIKNSERVWHQHQQQQQNSVPSQMEIAQDVLCRMIGDGKLGPSFLQYVDVNRLHGRDTDREQYIYDVRKNMSKNFLQLKFSLPSIESLICELSSVKSDDEVRQACGSVIRRTDFVTNELKALATIPINHPNLFILPDEIAVKLFQDTTLLTEKVFPRLRPAVALARPTGKDMKFAVNIAAALEDLIRIISKIDMYFSQYLIKDNV